MSITDLLALIGTVLGVINLTLKLQETRVAGPRLRVRVLRGSISKPGHGVRTRVLIANYGRSATTIQHCELATTNSWFRAHWRPWKAADSLLLPATNESQLIPGGPEIEYSLSEWDTAKKSAEYRYLFACVYITTKRKPIATRIPPWDWPPKGYKEDPPEDEPSWDT